MTRKLSTRNWEVIGICVILMVLVQVVFGRTVNFDFINYDDPACVYENATVSKGLSVENVGWAFTHCQLGHWDPLTTLSHMTDCQLYGLWAGGHHLTNVFLHAAAAVLLFLALLQMTGALWRCAFVAAVWAIHPLRVESVAWVSERKDVLSGLFFTLTLLAYGWYARRPSSPWRYAGMSASFALGLMSKSMLVTLPFVLLLLDYWPLKRFVTSPDTSKWDAGKRLILEKIPLLLVSFVIALVQMNADRRGIVALDKLPLVQRAANAAVSYMVYLWRSTRPVHLAVYYPYPRGSLALWEVAFAIAVLVVLSYAAFLARKEQPWLLVGWLWYLGMLVPVIGIVQSGTIASADRYTYLPQVGLCVAATWAAADFSGEHWRHRRWAPISIAVLVLFVLLVAAYRQASWWRDSVTLWAHTLEVTKENTLAHNNLGLALARQGRTEEAMAQYREVLQINPADAQAHCNLGLALLEQGQTEEAIAQYREAVRADPADAQAHSSLASALLQQGRAQEAITHYRKALEINPASPEAHNDLGNVLFQGGKTEEAVGEFREASRMNPGIALTHYNLGNALFKLGRMDEAIAEYREALRINPGFAPSHFNLGNALLRQGRPAEAVQEMQKAVDLHPADSGAENRLAWMLATVPVNSLRNGPRAIKLASQANESSGGKDPQVLRTLAAAYAETGEFPKAIQAAQHAMKAALEQSNAGLASEIGREIKLYEGGHTFENAQ